MKPLCFVLMPFGKKLHVSGAQIDFDAVYSELIRPAIQQASLEPLRADEEQTGGIIHKPMFERLILCEYAVADLTTANANVFYELGVRHAVRPASTALLFAAGTGQLPFDVAPLRAIPYQLTGDGKPANAAADCALLVSRLKKAMEAQKEAQRKAQKAEADSPVFQLVEGFPDIQHLKTDDFQERVAYSAQMKERIADARKQGIDALADVEEAIGDVAGAEAAVVLDLFLSYRAVKGWEHMIALAEEMSPALRATVMVQEQLGLALNRAGRGDEAEKVLLELIERRGPSSETYGILGRVYKDRWEAAVKQGQTALAQGFIGKAIGAYLKGFETDWRDAYPGVNAATLMEVNEPPDPRRKKLLPIVEYAAERRIAAGKPDYWDYATQLEVAVLRQRETDAGNALANALANIRAVWEPETTTRNLRLIREARERRGETVDWAIKMEKQLQNMANR